MADYDWRKVSADEFQFLIEDASGASLLVAPSRVRTDLLDWDVASPEWLIVHTGAHFGPVQVAVAHLSAAPSIGVEWEEVVEISVGCSEGLRVRELDGKPGPPIVNRGGQYRLRLSVSGRAAGAKRYSSSVRAKVLETYLFELWPAAPEPVRVLREIEPIEDAPVVLHHEQAGRRAAARLTEDLFWGPVPGRSPAQPARSPARTTSLVPRADCSPRSPTLTSGWSAEAQGATLDATTMVECTAATYVTACSTMIFGEDQTTCPTVASAASFSTSSDPSLWFRPGTGLSAR